MSHATKNPARPCTARSPEYIRNDLHRLAAGSRGVLRQVLVFAGLAGDQQDTREDAVERLDLPFDEGLPVHGEKRLVPPHAPALPATEYHGIHDI